MGLGRLIGLMPGLIALMIAAAGWLLLEPGWRIPPFPSFHLALGGKRATWQVFCLLRLDVGPGAQGQL